MEPYIHRVHYYETDKMGITHHSNYIRWMEESRVDFFDKIGYEYTRFEKEGMISPVASITCKYKKTTKFDERIRIYVKIKEFNGVKLSFEYIMKNDKEQVVFQGESSHCFLDENGKIVRVNKKYQEFAKSLEKHIK